MSNLFSSMEYDLVTLAMLMSLLGILILINTLLGSITAWQWGEWVTKKFWQGLLKNILIAACLFMFFLTIEIIPTVLARTGIIIPSDIVTVLEVFAMLVVSIKKYVLDIYATFKKLLGSSDEEIRKLTGSQNSCLSL